MIANMTGKSFPALTAPASAADIRSGKQAIGADGDIINGTADILQATTLTIQSSNLTVWSINDGNTSRTVYLGEIIVVKGYAAYDSNKVLGLTRLTQSGSTTNWVRTFRVTGENPSIATL